MPWDKEKAKQYKKVWRENNKERIKQKDKEWVEKNKERRKQTNRLLCRQTRITRRFIQSSGGDDRE